LTEAAGFDATAAVSTDVAAVWVPDFGAAGRPQAPKANTRTAPRVGCHTRA
jgi:hypothetical protein